ncbi:MAG: hypothetical protein EOO01_27450, partial [Chitinophagaceae bacterium]
YLLRAYTNWMKNFSPGFFFEKTLTIVNPFKPLGLPLLQATPDYDVQLFPEGGHLVQGLPGNVAFRTVDVSGRGVGLDVVKNALDSIGGRIQVDSVLGEGTTFTLMLPTSIAVKGGLLFQVEENYYAIPLIHTDSVVSMKIDNLHEVGGTLVTDIKGQTITVVSLRELLNAPPGVMDLGSKSKLTSDMHDIVIVAYNNRRIGLIVDRLIRQQDIVVKALNKPVDNIDIYGGVTLLGTGMVCLVLDVPSLVRHVTLRR